MSEELQVKSKQRVADHGEVFTAEREVKAMCDLVLNETERIDSRFLEPACGDGNFLREILARKLEVVRRRYGKSAPDFEFYSLVALTSIYGVELLADNVAACQERLFDQWNAAYNAACQEEANERARAIARFILEKNILCGNALSLMRVNDSGQDMDEPIIFTEWGFIGTAVKRREFRLDVLLTLEDENLRENLTFSLFDDDPLYEDYLEIDPKTGIPIPKPIREFPPIYYINLLEERFDNESVK